MKEGWWVNYRTGRYVELKCGHFDHEMALREPGNQAWLCVVASVAKRFARFQERRDRDALYDMPCAAAPSCASGVTAAPIRPSSSGHMGSTGYNGRSANGQGGLQRPPPC